MAEEGQMISRRNALSSLGWATAFGLVAFPSTLTVPDAEAQTAGMDRRQDRREGRRDRREDRRDARQDRREDRRDAREDRRENRLGGTTTGSTGSSTGTVGAAPK